MYTGGDNEPENWHWINSVLAVLLENITASLNNKEKKRLSGCIHSILCRHEYSKKK